MNEITEITCSAVDEAVKKLNKIRLNNKDSWVFAFVNLNGLEFKFKFYNTYIQIAENPDGLRGNAGMEMDVGQFKSYLLNFLKKA
jgi:hypothetical protein|tara:strand:- start:6957 stop:7211 length:255 start_codon:yes stop_codon:yes gene_type:complete